MQLAATIARRMLWNPDDPHEVHGTGIRAYGISRYAARYAQLADDYFSPGFEFHPGMTALDIGASGGSKGLTSIWFTPSVRRSGDGNR